MMNENVNLEDFCKYIKPIVTSCSAFVRTNGYVTHIPGRILMMSLDETFFIKIDIPVIYDMIFTANIGEFLFSANNDDSASDVFNNIYFLGYNIKYDSLMRYNNIYSYNEEYSNVYYYEEDCMNNIPDFEEYSKSSTVVKFINIITKDNFYKIPVSKAITSINKGDICSLKILDYLPNIQDKTKRTVKYIVYKKKFKLNVEIFFNILVI